MEDKKLTERSWKALKESMGQGELNENGKKRKMCNDLGRWQKKKKASYQKGAVDGNRHNRKKVTEKRVVNENGDTGKGRQETDEATKRAILKEGPKGGNFYEKSL